MPLDPAHGGFELGDDDFVSDDRSIIFDDGAALPNDLLAQLFAIQDDVGP